MTSSSSQTVSRAFSFDEGAQKLSQEEAFFACKCLKLIDEMAKNPKGDSCLSLNALKCELPFIGYNFNFSSKIGV